MKHTSIRARKWSIVILVMAFVSCVTTLGSAQPAPDPKTPPAEPAPPAPSPDAPNPDAPPPDAPPKDAPSPDAPSPDAPSPDSSTAKTAEELKAEGDAAMLDLRYDDALAAYQEAYALEPNPALLYNQGRAYQARGSYPAALVMLRQFNSDAPDDLKARVPRLAELIAELEGKVTTLTVVVNVEGATVSVRRKTIGTSPLAATQVNSGTAVITATKKGYGVVNQTVNLEGGKTQTVKFELARLATTGVVQVRAVAGARVFVDGKDQGAVPVDLELAPGKHSVVLRHDDYEEADTVVVIEAGQTRLHQVDMVRVPPITERWWFWGGIGVVTTAAAFVVAAAVLEGPIEEGTIEPGVVTAPLMTVIEF